MNVWSITKDLAIKHFLLELIHRYGENRFVCSQEHDHYQAIEISEQDCPDLCAYIYTFSQATGCYGVDLKYPFSDNNIVGTNENLNMEQLFSILETHFDL